MTTANEELKTVVRNWIAKRIVSVNDDYLAFNDYVKFHRIEEESATSGVYSTILKDADTSGQIEFVDTLDENEQEKVIVFLDANEEVVPRKWEQLSDTDNDFYEYIPWHAPLEEEAQQLVSSITSHALDDTIAQWKEDDPDNADKYEKLKTITHYEVRYIVGTIDKKMKVVGFNMFNDAIDSLESSISSQNATLISRVAELETRLNILISAFENDIPSDETLQAYIALLSDPEAVITDETRAQIEAAASIIGGNIDSDERSEIQQNFITAYTNWIISQL